MVFLYFLPVLQLFASSCETVSDDDVDVADDNYGCDRDYEYTGSDIPMMW